MKNIEKRDDVEEVSLRYNDVNTCVVGSVINVKLEREKHVNFQLQ